jgi:hypothetical protein
LFFCIESHQPLPNVLRHQRRHDHPQGVVINPPLQPQQKVIVDLVSVDNEYLAAAQLRADYVLGLKKIPL